MYHSSGEVLSQNDKPHGKKLIENSIRQILREEWCFIFREKRADFCRAGLLPLFWHDSTKHFPTRDIIDVCNGKGMMLYMLDLKFLILKVAELHLESYVFSLIIFDK